MNAIEHAYEAALARVVEPGRRVLDLGGTFGRHAVVACRLGAERAYSVQSGESLVAANAVVLANGCAERIRCIENIETIPDRIDVLVGRTPGDVPLHGLSLVSQRTTRDMLAQGATPIPRQEHLSMAVVDAPDLYHRHAGVWDVGWGLDFAVAKRLALNTWSQGRVQPGQLLVEPYQWTTFSYCSPKTSVAGAVDWTVERAGTAHGLAVWPEVIFAEGVILSGAPSIVRAPFRQAFFPWADPVSLAVGDHISVTVRADGLGAGNVWTWSSSIRRAGADTISFNQSTFFGSSYLPVW